MKKMRNPVATWVILAICIAIQMAITFLGKESTTETAILLGAYYKSFIVAGEYWRLLTCGFVHISIFHLFMNGMSLLNIGSAYEQRFGVIRYLAILFVSIIGGSLFSFCMQGNIVAVGLSGGLYGLMGGYILMLITSGLYKNPAVLSQLMRVLIINVMINFMPGVAVSAHLGGFIAGMIMTAFFLEMEKSFKIRMGICGLVLCGVLGYYVTQNTAIRTDQVYLLSDYRILSMEKELGFSSHAYHMAEKLDKIYATGSMLQTMLEDGE